MKSVRQEIPDQDKPGKILSLVSAKILLVSLCFISALFFFIFLAYIATSGEEYFIDRKVTDFFSGYATPPVVALMEKITFFGSSGFLFPAYIILIFWFLFRKRVNTAINIAVVAFTAYALTNALKAWFGRQRPDMPLIESLKTGSFPSGHTISSFVFCMVLIHLLGRSNLPNAMKWVLYIVLIIFSLLIGISRIILHMHYPTDVIGGYCFGVVWVLLSFWVFRTMERRKNLS
jgi:membrane-associated phospholipid phosphatase